jgi:hypothetical protein
MIGGPRRTTRLGYRSLGTGESGKRGRQDGAGDGCRGSAGRLKRALAVGAFHLQGNMPRDEPYRCGTGGVGRLSGSELYQNRLFQAGVAYAKPAPELKCARVSAGF